MAYYEDITMDQGSDFNLELQLLNSDGSKRDVTNYVVQGKINRSYDADSDEAVLFTTRFIEPRTSGLINLSLSNQQTDLLNYKRKYVYDVEVTFDDNGINTVERIVEGKVFVSPSVTR